MKGYIILYLVLLSQHSNISKYISHTEYKCTVRVVLKACNSTKMSVCALSRI